MWLRAKAYHLLPATKKLREGSGLAFRHHMALNLVPSQTTLPRYTLHLCIMASSWKRNWRSSSTVIIEAGNGTKRGAIQDSPAIPSYMKHDNFATLKSAEQAMHLRRVRVVRVRETELRAAEHCINVELTWTSAYSQTNSKHHATINFVAIRTKKPIRAGAFV